MAQIASAIAEEAEADPAGDVAGSARIRTGIAKRSARDIRQIVLRSNADGSSLTVGDVARVTEEGVDRDRAYFVGAASAISIRIDRSDQGDAIEIQEQVQTTAAAMMESLPPDVNVELIRRAWACAFAVIFVFECAHGLLGGRRNSGGYGGGFGADVSVRADDQYDLAFCFDHYPWDCGR